jgi:mannosyltransferase
VKPFDGATQTNSSQSSGDSPRFLPAAAVAYLALIGIYAATKPLWLDELLELTSARSASLALTAETAAQNPGGVPLGYLLEHLLSNLFGISPLALRLLPVLCAVGTILATRKLGQRVGLTAPWLSAALLALLPVQIRYATEARPYSLALLFTTWSTVALLWLRDSPSPARWFAYLGLCVMGVYSQPYALFVTAGHAIWLLFDWFKNKATSSRTNFFFRISAIGATILTPLLFFPWYRYAASKWNTALDVAQYVFPLSAKTPLLVLRELTGGGYIATAILILFAIPGFRALRSPALRTLVLCCAALTILLPLAADGLVGYFVASRQFLFALPFLCLLAAEGISSTAARNPKLRFVPIAILALLTILNIRPAIVAQKENWKAATLAAHQELRAKGNHSGCVLFAPAEAAQLYALANPDVSNDQCGQEASGERSRPRVLLVSPYALAPDRRNAVATLAERSLTVRGRRLAGLSEVWSLEPEKP